MEKGKKYGIVAAVVVIIIVVAAIAWYATSDNGSRDNDDTDPVEESTYYFYLDGFSDDIDGWYDGVGANAQEGISAGLEDAGIACEWNSGMITIEDYVNTSTPDYSSGVGNGIYYYYSTDLVNYVSASNFILAPSIANIPGNVIYISYGPYTMDPVTYETTYELNPETTESDMITTGPFAGDYKIPSFETYYFYLDGFSDEIDGWYDGVGDNAQEAINAALDAAGISYNWNSDLITIEDYVGTYDPDTLTGIGNGVYFYYSTDHVNYVAPENFVMAPAIPDIPSNVIYISYGSYSMDPVTYETIYELNPETTESDMMTTGPFATA